MSSDDEHFQDSRKNSKFCKNIFENFGGGIHGCQQGKTCQNSEAKITANILEIRQKSRENRNCELITAVLNVKFCMMIRNSSNVVENSIFFGTAPLGAPTAETTHFEEAKMHKAKKKKK